MRRPWFLEPAAHEVQAWLNYETGDLAACGRVLLALANDRQPDPDDLKHLELPGGGRGFQSALHARTGDAPAGGSEVVQQVRRVLNAAQDAEQAEKEP